MKNWRLLVPSRFIEAVGFEGQDYTFTIAKIGREVLEGEGNAKKIRGTIQFEEKHPDTGEPLLWLLNVTNATALMNMFGEDYERWVGKRVTLYPQAMKVQGEQTMGIRVRGSPDLDREVLRYQLKLPRKKPVPVELRRTGQQRGAPAQRSQQQRPPARAHPADDPPMEEIMRDYPGEPGAGG